MNSPHRINNWIAPESGPGGFNPLEPSLLWLAEDHQPGQPRPGFVFVHRWGGYPHERIALKLGTDLAERGYVFLSQCLRRKGMEGQLMSVPDNDNHDIRLAVDHLQTNGCTDLFLIGEEVGALSVLRYQVMNKDPRVRGLCLVDPPSDLPDWLAGAVGADAYADALKQAGVAARQGAGMDYRIDLFPDNGPAVTQQAGAFLAWWSPMADTRVAKFVAETTAPMLVISGNQKEIPACFSETPGKTIELLPGKADAQILTDWAAGLGSRLLEPTHEELVHVDSGGDELYGVLWQPTSTETDTAVLLMHGLTSSPASPLFGKMAPILAQQFGVLAVESHRSGWAGHESALLDQDLEDLDAWVSFLLERGFNNIVLAGASMGSLSIGRYQSIRQQPNVIGLAHLMPTADCPDWFRKAAGDGPYEAAAEQAQQAVTEGRGTTELIDIDVRQPPPSQSRGRFRWTQRAASWLSWWGPDADSRNSVHITKANVPILLLSGTADSYNDEARFAELKAAAVNAPRVDEIWYDDIDHGLAGAETRTADDLANWIRGIRN